jgi:hypothetical protein
MMLHDLIAHFFGKCMGTAAVLPPAQTSEKLPCCA